MLSVLNRAVQENFSPSDMSIQNALRVKECIKALSTEGVDEINTEKLCQYSLYKRETAHC